MEKIEKQTIYCLVQDYAGALVNIASSFTDKGINIRTVDSGEPDENGRSRVTIMVKCSEAALKAVIEHLRKLPYVIEVEDLNKGDLIERQLMLVRVRAVGEDIARIMQHVEIFRASIAGMGEESLIIEMAGPESKVDALAHVLKPFGILEIARTGRVAIESEEHAGSKS